MAVLAEQMDLVALCDERRGQSRVVDVRAGAAEQVAVEDEDAHRASLAGASRRPRAPAGRSDRVCAVSMSQRYRLRNPASGREVVLEAEPGEIYLDRETGEQLEVVGKVLPLALRARTCRGRWRTSASATGASSSPRRTSTTARPAAVAWVRSDRARETVERSPPAAGRALAVALALLLAAGTMAACGGGTAASDATPKSTPDITPPNDTSAEKAAAQTTSTSTTTKQNLHRRKRRRQSGGNEATEEPESGGSSSGAGEQEATPSGGASAEKETETEKSAAGSSPSGGASAPTGK